MFHELNHEKVEHLLFILLGKSSLKKQEHDGRKGPSCLSQFGRVVSSQDDFVCGLVTNLRLPMEGFPSCLIVLISPLIIRHFLPSPFFVFDSEQIPFLI
jgi:hypothetical protein